MATAEESEELLKDVRVSSRISEDGILIYVTHDELDVAVAIQAQRGEKQHLVLSSILVNLPKILVEIVRRRLEQSASDPLEDLWRASTESYD